MRDASTFRHSPRSDPYRVYKFHVRALVPGYLDPAPDAGFANVTMPQQSVEQMEYSEGIYTYSRSYPGRSSFSTVTLSRGLFRGDTYFARWMRRTAEGTNYRIDLEIGHFHTTDLTGLSEYGAATPSIKYVLHNCHPVRFAPGTDLDAMSGDVSLQEIEIAYEHFTVYNKYGKEIGSGGEVVV